MKKELFVILGNHKTGKSITIRGLTSMFRKGKCIIETDNGNIDIYVLISALQEAGLAIDKAVEVLGEHERLLIPLHISGGSIYPGALEYIQAFRNAGFTVSQLVALGNNQDAVGNIQKAFPQTMSIDTFKDMPNNHAASQIREAWGWR